MKKMHILIDRQGKTSIEVEGANGEDCHEFTRAIEESVGTVEHSEPRPPERVHVPTRVTEKERS